MTTIKELIDIEEVLLKADMDIKYSYSMDELIKSEKYLKEIGSITNLFFSIQLEYSKINNDENLKEEYYNKMLNDEIDIEINDYLLFILHISSRLMEKEYFKKIQKLLTKIKCQ